MTELPLVAHSVLAADRLAAEVSDRYDLGGPVRGQLLFRGMNDVYVMRTEQTRFALRAWRGGWRAIEEVEGELAFLNFLRNRGFNASFPVPARDGSWYFTLQAPEGARPAALYEWAEGVKFNDALDLDTAREIGRQFALLHRLGLDFVPPHPVDISVGSLIDDLPYLLDLVYDRPDDVRDYPALAVRMTAALDAMAERDLPRGACHGDLHPSNLHIAPDGRITFLDFDGCGYGYFLRDIANFVFGNDFYGFDKSYGDAFVAGYDEVRPLTGDEHALLDFFVLAKTFQLAGGIARNINSVGRASLKFRGLGWFAETIRSRWVGCQALLGPLEAAV